MIPRTEFSIDESDGKMLVRWCKELGIRTVLEFGPGYSTNFFLEAGCQITAAESDGEWARAFQKHPESKQVKLVPFEANALPLVLSGVPPYFDLTFVDAPKGHVFPCSRVNAAIYGYHHSDYIIMHDSNRPGELLTVRILQSLGCQIVHEFTASVGGMTLLKI